MDSLSIAKNLLTRYINLIVKISLLCFVLLCYPIIGEAGYHSIDISSAVKTSSSEQNGQAVINLNLEDKPLLEQLTENPLARNYLVAYPNSTDRVELNLTRGQVQAFASRQAFLELRALKSTFTIPIKEIDLEETAKEVEVDPNTLQVKIVISSLPWEETGLIRLYSQMEGLEQAAEPVEFKVMAVAGDNHLEIKGFKSHLRRTINLSKDIDINRATGVVLSSDGKLNPVPTQFNKEDGRTIAILKYRNGGFFTVVETEKVFTDLQSHWAERSIQVMASKLLVNGTGKGSFLPDQKVTRAQFTVMLTKALGFEPSRNNNNFKDIKSNHWFAGPVGAAWEAGLVQGYQDGTFRPNAFITREQVATMLAQAKNLVDRGRPLTQDETDLILGDFPDGMVVSPWAREPMASAVQNNIICGDESGALNPGGYCTRAEAVLMIKRMMISLGLLTPTLDIQFPLDGMKTNKHCLRVSGTTEPGSSLEINNKAVEIKDEGSFVSDVVYLSYGNNTISIKLTDPSGNKAALTRRVIYDKSAPSFHILEPALKHLTRNNPFAIRGCTEPGSTVFINDIPVKLGTDGSFSKTVFLNPGVNVMTAKATDQAGNVSTVTSEITYDHIAPGLWVVTPGDGLATGTDMAIVSGYAEPESDLQVNWTPVTVDSKGNFSKVVDLAVGDNTIFVTAADKAGNIIGAVKKLTFNNNRVTQLQLPSQIKIGSSIIIQYALSMDGYALVEVSKEDGELVNVIQKETFKQRGSHFLMWNGKDREGNFVSDDKYRFLIELKDKEGNKIGSMEKIQVAARQPVLSKVSKSPDPFDPINDAQCQFKFDLSHNTLVTLKIYQNFSTVAEVCYGVLYQAGSHTVYWDGKDEIGKLLKDGSYSYTFEAVNPIEPTFKSSFRGSLAIEKEPPKISEAKVGPDPLYIGTFGLSINYFLSEDARVSIKVVDSAQKVVRTLCTDMSKRAGPASHYWDGKNDSGKNISHGSYKVVITAVDNYNKPSAPIELSFKAEGGGFTL